MATAAGPASRPSGPAAVGGQWVAASPFAHKSVGPDALAVRPRSPLLTCSLVSDLGDMLARTQVQQLVVDLRDVHLDSGAADALAAVDQWMRQHRSGRLTVRLNGAVQVIALASRCQMLIG
jgi:hypothetical protein